MLLCAFDMQYYLKKNLVACSFRSVIDNVEWAFVGLEGLINLDNWGQTQVAKNRNLGI